MKSWGNKEVKVAADAIVLRGSGAKREVLLVKRGKEPFKGMWALPGGFLETGESLGECVAREVLEETGVKVLVKGISGVYSRPGRDPRGRTVTVAYICKAVGGKIRGGDDAAEARWWRLDEIGRSVRLAFDHREILEGALAVKRGFYALSH